jgi:hypothetical protein
MSDNAMTALVYIATVAVLMVIGGCGGGGGSSASEFAYPTQEAHPPMCLSGGLAGPANPCADKQ